MFKLNNWNENEKYSPKNIAQDVIDTSGINTSCCVDTTNLDMIETSCSSSMKTSCCIDTTRINAGPCGGDIKTSCCIDTTRINTGPCGGDIKTSCCIDTAKE